MTIKIHYINLTILLSIISFLYFLWHLRNDFPIFNFVELKYIRLLIKFTLFYIIIRETITCSPKIRLLIFSLLPFTIIGYLFIIQHWPNGKLIFLISGISILSILLFSNRSTNKNLRLLILSIPGYFIIGRFITIFNPCGIILTILHYYLIITIAIILIFKLVKRKIVFES